MIKKIAHFADIHVFKSLERHDEYKKIFEKVYNKLKEQHPDRIVIVGDTYNDYIDLEGEALILIGEFLNNLSQISPVIITRGNHEIRKKNRSRIDTIKTVTDLLDNPKITYYNKSGFYIDSNIVWVVWDHVEHRYHGINPWKDIQHKRDKSLIYIDLYHDPIDGCSFYNDYIPTRKNFIGTKDFKGDYSFFGDIHLRQFFNNKTKAYCGSLIQNNFGEDPFNHGYLLWDVENGGVEEVNIENDFKYIKFTINPNTDYDNLNLISKYAGVYNNFRVDWNDYAVYINNDNENKIKNHIKSKYNATNIEIKPYRIYSDIKESKMLSEILDINNSDIQQKIIIDYLKENKRDKEFIDKVIDIDNIINSRLSITDTKNIIWNIEKMWFNNFKSYGDDNIIEWDNINGIIQIGGENQQGKTTIIDAISFILYGVTSSTIKSEKNGNNRYINKNRNLDYCDGGIVLNVNDEKYIIYRKVNREIKKNGEIKSVPMILDYYKGDIMDDKNKLTGERKNSTQKLMDGILGDFEDFIRLTLTNADNLNSLLSMDRSIFIDSIIKDAGYDIFDKKLNEFKEYKKELNSEKIVINQSQVEEQIENIKNELKNKKSQLLETNNDIEKINNIINDKLQLKESLLLKLNKIDNKYINIDIDNIKNKIINDESILKKIISDIDLIKIDNLPNKFDLTEFDNIINEYNKSLSEKNNRDIELYKLQNLYKQNEDKINNVDKNINIEKTKYIYFLKDNIANLKVEMKEYINDINNNTNIKINEIERQRNILKDEISSLKEKGLNEKENIDKYNNLLSGDEQICPTCNQLIINKDDNHVNELINESMNKIKDITTLGKKKIDKLKELSSNLDSLKLTSSKLIDEKSNEYEDKIKTYKDRIENFNESLIQDRIQEIIDDKEKCISDNNILTIKINERQNYINKLEKDIKILDLKIQKLKIEKSLYDKYVELNTKKQRLSIDLRETKLNLDNNKNIISEYNRFENLILENQKIESELKQLGLDLKSLDDDKKNLMDNKLSYSSEIALYSKALDDLQIKLNKYIEQEKTEEVYGSYLKLMHRTGIPTYLLSKNIDILNNELNSLLSNINFTLFFDEDLNLKLQHDGLDGVINVIEASGAERVFSSIALKIVLRLINFRSKPNFMIFDEVLNKLVNKSVDRFMELLNVIKTKIDKIIIIEHNVEIPSDVIISVQKNSDGVSSFDIF